MAKSKNSGTSRSRLSTTSSQGAPVPAVTTIHAAGESTLSEETSQASRPGPDRKTSTDSLASTAARSTASSATLRQEFHAAAMPRDTDDHEKPGSRRSWFGRRGTTLPRPLQKSHPVTKIAQEQASGSRPSTPPDVGDQQPTAATLHVDPRVTVKKSLPKLKQDFSMRNASTLSLSTPLRMKPSPPTVAPPQETPAPPEPRAETPPPPPPVAPEPESAPVEAPKDEPETHQLETAEQPVGWVAWWYGQPATPAVPPIDIAPEPEEEPVKEPEVQPPPPEDPLGNDVAPPSLDVPKDSVNPSQPQARSWFGIWSAATQEVPAGLDAKTADVPAELPVKVAAPPPIEPTPPPPVTVEVVQPADQEAATSSAPPSNGYYGWGFWSRGAADTASGTTVEGEIAIAGEASESNPQKANVKLPDMVSTALRPSSVVSLPALVTQAENAKSTKIKTAKSAKLAASKKAEAVTAPPSIAPVIESSAAKKTLQKILPQNHLLPAFESCYRHPDQPSIVQQFAKIFRNSPPSKDHLHLSRQIPKVKKAVAIGVHGFFPMRLVRTVLGEPTGTSVRFANHAANSIKRWAEKNGVEIEVETIALEGEGKVADRVEMLWELLQNWIEQVRSADFIILAAHSQGVVVGIQLLARLIETGCVDNVRIGFTAMAGINLGPFGHLPTTLLTGSAKELFEFQKQESTVSKKYMEAIRVVLARDVRILYVGSIDDQLVPLESSTISTISHPYIYRAVFVDGRVHAPDFLSHLVGFAMKLRNLGVSDHRLIRELSTPLAGSLYGGEGHSRIYDDGAVYDLGVRHALETADCPGVPLKVEPFELPLANNGNPYFLPWSLRGMLEETIVRNQLAPECSHLLEQFENWKPTSKILKDVKFRLEGIRSKL